MLENLTNTEGSLNFNNNPVKSPTESNVDESKNSVDLLSNLPKEILRIILKDSIESPKDLHNLSLVCKEFNKDDMIWKVYTEIIGLQPLHDSVKIDGNVNGKSFNEYPPYKKSYFFYKNELVKALTQVKEFDEAKALINQITDPFWKVKAQIELVKALAQANRFDEAKALINQITDPYLKAKAQIELVKVLPGIKEIDEAKALINQITDPYEKVKAQCQFLQALFKS